MDGKRERGRPRRQLEWEAQDVFDMSLWLAKNPNEFFVLVIGNPDCAIWLKVILGKGRG